MRIIILISQNSKERLRQAENCAQGSRITKGIQAGIQTCVWSQRPNSGILPRGKMSRLKQRIVFHLGLEFCRFHPPTHFYISYVGFNIYSGNSPYAKIIHFPSILHHQFLTISVTPPYASAFTILVSVLLIYKTFRNAREFCSFCSEE